MARTTETALTETWVQVVTDGADYVLQNNGNNPIWLFWKAAQPSGADHGFEVKPGDGIDSGTFLTGAIWARAATNKLVGSVAVNV